MPKYLKIGDKVLCKTSLYNVSAQTYYFIKDKYYEIVDIRDEIFYIKGEFKNVEMDVLLYKKVFYTLQDVRKMRIEKLFKNE